MYCNPERTRLTSDDLTVNEPSMIKSFNFYLCNENSIKMYLNHANMHF